MLDQARLAIDLEAWLFAEGMELERRLPARFWRRPAKGDLREVMAALPPAQGPLTAAMRQVTIDALWAWLRDDPRPARLRAYFRWAARERAAFVARAVGQAHQDAHVEFPAGGEVPGGLARLPSGVEALKSYVRAVRREFRRQESSFEAWAQSTGLLHLAIHMGQQPSRTRDDGEDDPGLDPLAGWQPGFEMTSIVGDQVRTFELAARGALDQLGIKADFRLTDPVLREQVENLVLDQISGIDNTTREGLRKVLLNNAGGTIADLGKAIEDYWDQASLTRGITIAATEMARASALAEIETYRRNAVEMVEFSGFPSGDECDSYLGNTYPADSADAQSLIPVHPRCTLLGPGPSPGLGPSRHPLGRRRAEPC